MMADAENKALLLEMAQVWVRLAEQVAAAKHKHGFRLSAPYAASPLS
jgi:hypothetical protein